MNPLVVAPLLLICAHYLADFAMQTEFMALMKAKVHTDEHGWHALIAHSMHHASLSLIVCWWVSQSFTIGLIAMVVTGLTHGIIDYLKAVKNSFSVKVDQALHLAIAILIGISVGTYVVGHS